MDSPYTGQSAPYGQACMQCFKAKSKCILRESGDKCERCHRLGRQCAPSDPIRRRRAQRNSGSNVTQLEKRIDSLVSLLQSATKSPNAIAALRLLQREAPYNQNMQDVGDDPETNITRKVTSFTAAAPTSLPSPSDNDIFEEIQANIGGPGPALTPPSTYGLPMPDVELDIGLSIGEQKACLDRFISKLLPTFPFTHFPPDISVETLRANQPYLLRAICTVATPSTKVKLARGEQLKKLLCKELLVEGKSSLDLLSATLTFAAWSYDQFLAKKNVSRFVMMAMSIVYELRLNSGEGHTHSLIEQPGFRHVADPQNEAAKATLARGSRGGVLERSRAVLGCFLLSSCIAPYYQQIEPMQWTSNLEKFLQMLEANKDCQSDVTLSAQIRLQLIHDKLKEIEGLQNSFSPATTLYLGAVREQLRGVEDSIPPNLPESDALLTYCRFIELRICELAGSTPSADPTSRNPLDFQRVDGILKFFKALECCFECWMAMPHSFWAHFSLIYVSQVCRCLSALFTFATYEDPAWGLQAAQIRAEALEIVDRLIEKSRWASSEAGETADDDLWRQIVTKMVRFRACIVSRTASKNSSKVDTDVPLVDTFGSIPAQIVTPSMMLQVPPYGFYGTGEWMERIFDGPFF